MKKRFAVRLYSPYDISIVAFALNKSKHLAHSNPVLDRHFFPSRAR